MINLSESEGLLCVGVKIAVITMVLQSDNDNEDVFLVMDENMITV